MGSGNSPFPVWVSRNCSAAVLSFWSRGPFGGDVWFATSNSCMFLSRWVFSVVWVAKTLLMLSNSWCSTDVSRVCCRTTSKFDKSFVVLFVSGLSSALPEWRRSVFNFYFRPQLGHSFALFCVSCHWFWLCVIGPVCLGGGLFADLAPKWHFYAEFFFLAQVSKGRSLVHGFLSFRLCVMLLLLLLALLLIWSELILQLLTLPALFSVAMVWFVSLKNWRHWFR